MVNLLKVISELLPPLSNIQHPLEGCFYLVLIALFVRWIWPDSWNKFLESISVEVKSGIEHGYEDQDLQSK